MGPALNALPLELQLRVNLSLRRLRFRKRKRTFPGLSLYPSNRRRYNSKMKAEEREEFPSAKY